MLVHLLAIDASAVTTGVGTLHVATPVRSKVSGVRRLLVVRGHLLTGDVTMSLVDGKTYFGNVCADCDVKPWRPVTTRRSRRIDPDKLSQRAFDILAAHPWVLQRVAHGTPVRQAIVDFVAAQDSMMDAISAAYRHALAAHAESPADSGRAKIDPDIAVVQSDGPRAPTFGPDGSVDVFIHGLGYRGINNGPPPRLPGPSDPLERARERHRMFELALEAPSTVLIVVTSTADLILVGSDAVAALRDVDETVAGPNVPVADIQSARSQRHSLPDDALEEIRQVARGANNPGR